LLYKWSSYTSLTVVVGDVSAFVALGEAVRGGWAPGVRRILFHFPSSSLEGEEDGMEEEEGGEGEAGGEGNTHTTGEGHQHNHLVYTHTTQSENNASLSPPYITPAQIVYFCNCLSQAPDGFASLEVLDLEGIHWADHEPLPAHIHPHTHRPLPNPTSTCLSLLLDGLARDGVLPNLRGLFLPYDALKGRGEMVSFVCVCV
jgi:hypothetical protein